MDFAVQAWRPWQRGDIDSLKRVHRKMVTAFSGHCRTYEERLVEIGMGESRREWLDMVQTYKIVEEVNNVDRTHWFTMRGEEGSHETRATQRGLNIIGKRSKLEVRRNFYSQRVVDSWNGLFVETKLAINVAEFNFLLI